MARFKPWRTRPWRRPPIVQQPDREDRWGQWEGTIIVQHGQNRRCRFCGIHLPVGTKAWLFQTDGTSILSCMQCRAERRTESEPI